MGTEIIRWIKLPGNEYTVRTGFGNSLLWTSTIKRIIEDNEPGDWEETAWEAEGKSG